MFESEINLDIIGDLPRVKKWAKTLRDLPSVQSVVAPNFVELLKDFVVNFDGVMGQKLAA